MRSRSFLFAALAGAFGALVATTPVAFADDEDDYEEVELEGDGPEAEAVKLFGIDELIDVAVRRSPDLVRARVDRVVAKGNAGAAGANQQWTMSMGAQYKQNAIGEQVQVQPFEVVRTDTLDASIGLGRNLPTGGSFSVEAGVNRTFREYNIDLTLLEQATGTANAGQPAAQNGADPYQDKFTRLQSTARATLKQPLVRGFGPDVALAPQKKADYELAASTVQAQLAAEDMVREIVTGYWELAYATYAVDTRAEGVALAEGQEKLTREELRAGKTAQNAVNAVIYEIAVRQEAYLTAQLEAEKKSLDLRRKVGLGLGRREILMRPKQALEIGEYEWDIEEVLAQSRKANRKLATLALQKKVADVDVKVAKNATLPQVDVSLSGAVLGGGDTTGEAFSALGSSSGYEVMAGLSVSFELSGAAKSAHSAAVARKKRLEVDRLDLERQIDAEVVNAVKAVTAARTRVALSDKAIQVAEENVRAERLNFTAGKTTNFSVMQRQGELIEARLRRGRAVADYHVAVAQLQYLSGTILDQYRVNTRPSKAR